MRSTNKVLEVGFSDTFGCRTVRSIPSTGYSYQPRVFEPPVCRGRGKTGNWRRRREARQTQAHRRLKCDSSNTVFDGADGVERNVVRVGTKVLLECVKIWPGGVSFRYGFSSRARLRGVASVVPRFERGDRLLVVDHLAPVERRWLRSTRVQLRGKHLIFVHWPREVEDLLLTWLSGPRYYS